jgi:hypothetical protein
MVLSFTVLLMAGRTRTALVGLKLAIHPFFPRKRHRYSVLAVGFTVAETAPVDDEVLVASSAQVLVPFLRCSRRTGTPGAGVLVPDLSSFPLIVAEPPAVRLVGDEVMEVDVAPRVQV